jgi:hypothetical protein
MSALEQLRGATSSSWQPLALLLLAMRASARSGSRERSQIPGCTMDAHPSKTVKSKHLTLVIFKDAQYLHL